MILEIFYSNLENIPEKFRELFTEKDDKWVLTGVKGLKTSEDIERLQKANRNERESHDETKQKLNKLLEVVGDKTPEELQKNLDDFEDLSKSGVQSDNSDAKFTQEQIDEKINIALERKERETSRIIAKLETERDSFSEENTHLKKDIKESTIRDVITKVSSDAGLLSSAIGDVQDIALRICDIDEDGKVIVREGQGDISGMDISTVIKEEWVQSKSYFYEASKSGGGKSNMGDSGLANNPFSKESQNLTEQSKMVKENPEKAKRFIASAGLSPKDYFLE